VKVIDQSWRFVSPKFETPEDSKRVLNTIEECGRICYQSDKNESEPFIRGLIHKGHLSVLEHEKATVIVTTNRSVTHEIVRHRVGVVYSQESTRYCNYSKGKFGSEITVILSVWFRDVDFEKVKPFIEDPTLEIQEGYLTEREQQYISWYYAMKDAEKWYMKLMDQHQVAQEARDVLPNSLKSSIAITMNMHAWRHFFNLRALGTTGKPHPQMLDIATSLLKGFSEKLPVLFDDQYNKYINQKEVK
jgi:thymidylate synthase (FAD)